MTNAPDNTSVANINQATPLFSSPDCASDYYPVKLHFQGRSYGMLKRIDLPGGGPVPWAPSATVGTTFLPWQTNGFFPANVAISAVQGAPSDESLMVQGDSYAMLYCALPAAERTMTLARTVVVIGTIDALLPDICSGTRPDARCPSGVAKIYGYRLTVDERLAGALPDTARHIKVLHATGKPTALTPQPGMQVLLFIRSGLDGLLSVVNPPTDPEADYWVADPDAAYLIDGGAGRWMENPPNNPAPPLAIVRQQVQTTFAGVQAENPLLPLPTPTAGVPSGTPKWQPTPKPTINIVARFRLAETRRIVLDGPRLTQVKGGPEIIDDPVRIAAIVAGLDHPVPLGRESTFNATAWDFTARFERADGTVALCEHFEGGTLFFRGRFSDQQGSVPLEAVGAVLDIFGVFGGPRIR